jgi:hypothetical protein
MSGRPSVCPSFVMYQRRLPLNVFPSNMMGAFMKICRQNPYLAQIGHFSWRPKYVLLVLAKFNQHKSALFEWNGITLQGQPKRYKHFANAPQCYVTRTLPVLLFNDCRWQLCLGLLHYIGHFQPCQKFIYVCVCVYVRMYMLTYSVLFL